MSRGDSSRTHAPATQKLASFVACRQPSCARPSRIGLLTKSATSLLRYKRRRQKICSSPVACCTLVLHRIRIQLPAVVVADRPVPLLFRAFKLPSLSPLRAWSRDRASHALPRALQGGEGTVMRGALLKFSFGARSFSMPRTSLSEKLHVRPAELQDGAVLQTEGGFSSQQLRTCICL
ncbi:uncharacterized protein J3D65DRAFT_610143 [Phyllosticta citribraziliensis]|uniref:Uncharacterized protein n=1 Tax=Phyllosticta citribraziliensis TaxID=989973 RepID=A0ABR1MBE1_9PEZI